MDPSLLARFSSKVLPAPRQPFRRKRRRPRICGQSQAERSLAKPGVRGDVRWTVSAKQSAAARGHSSSTATRSPTLAHPKADFVFVEAYIVGLW